MALPLVPILSSLFGFITKPIAAYQEERKVIKVAKINRRAKEVDNAHEWEKNVLIKSGIFLRWACVLHLFAGMDYTIYAVFSGKDSDKLWTALDKMPEWYSGLLMTVFAFAFASAPLKSAGGALAAKWRKGSGAITATATTAFSQDIPELDLTPLGANPPARPLGEEP